MNSIEYIRREIQKEIEELHEIIDDLSTHNLLSNEENILAQSILDCRILNNLLVCLNLFINFSK